MAFANAASIPLFAFLLAGCVGLYRLRWRTTPVDALAATLEPHWTWLAAGFIACVLAHESLHVVGFRLGGVAWRDITLGMHWRLLTPYASTGSPMSARAYRVAILLPGLVLGVIPVATAMLVEHPTLFWYGTVMLGVALGDALALWMVRGVAGDFVVVDLADRVGCQIVAPAATITGNSSM